MSRKHRPFEETTDDWDDARLVAFAMSEAEAWRLLGVSEYSVVAASGALRRNYTASRPNARRPVNLFLNNPSYNGGPASDKQQAIRRHQLVCVNCLKICVSWKMHLLIDASGQKFEMCNKCAGDRVAA